ncbi:hypothetical protein CEXT_192691 [Caerostris extrusa]|uniref:Uncharacterized protein n=1 Tax=Caerostris extrusa TaxID=172846 RepID=A0AAV4STY7_CAEEX|nr:hypothetical protein CEXT_192691 [Caerostris extrusa]
MPGTFLHRPITYPYLVLQERQTKLKSNSLNHTHPNSSLVVWACSLPAFSSSCGVGCVLRVNALRTIIALAHACRKCAFFSHYRSFPTNGSEK